jgi:hypothetical protein
MLSCEQRRLLFKQMPSALGWLLVGVMLTITVGQYQGNIEVRFGEMYLNVKGEAFCEVVDK